MYELGSMLYEYSISSDCKICVRDTEKHYVSFSFELIPQISTEKKGDPERNQV